MEPCETLGFLRSMKALSILIGVVVVYGIPVKAAEMPSAVQRIIDQRKAAMKKIDEVYVRELRTLQTGFMKSSDLENANLVEKLIKEAGGSTSPSFSLDGKWVLKKANGVLATEVRKFEGDMMVFVDTNWKIPFEVESDTLTVWMNRKEGHFEKLKFDPKSPDELKGENYRGEKISFVRIK